MFGFIGQLCDIRFPNILLVGDKANRGIKGALDVMWNKQEHLKTVDSTPPM